MLLNRMPQVLTSENFVHVPPSITNVLQISVSFQLNDNVLNCSLSDSDFHSNVPYSFRRVFGQAQQNVRMIR